MKFVWIRQLRPTVLRRVPKNKKPQMLLRKHMAADGDGGLAAGAQQQQKRLLYISRLDD